MRLTSSRARPGGRAAAVFQAFLVTFLWSTSWVLIKIGLRDLPALSFAGLRYTLAFLLLLPFAIRPLIRSGAQRLPARRWLEIVALGLLLYTLTQGSQFLGLSLLPAVTVNLMLSFTSVVVALLGTLVLSEGLSARRWAGIGLALVGALVYFHPVVIPPGQALGYSAVTVGLLANAGASVLGRSVNRRAELTPLAITTVSMGIGGLLLLVAGFSLEGLPPLSLRSWAIIGWLAAVNTAFAFTLWNHTLRSLSAVESSVINNTMLIQIPILAVLFLGESLSLKGAAGLAIAAVGTLLVQLHRTRSSPPAES